MIRIVIENVFFFLLPTLAYIAFIAFKTNRWPGLGTVMKGAPLLKLFAAGAALMVTTLIAFSSTSGGRPGDTYQPPVFKDGHVEPGHSTPQTK